MRIIDLAYDERIRGLCATITCTYEWYLNATAGAEQNLEIQREIVRESKAYRTLRADLKRGAILPPTVLAISKIRDLEAVDYEALQDEAVRNRIMSALKEKLSAPSPEQVYIIDGLQRTNALRQIRDEYPEIMPERRKFLARPLRVEVWINIEFSSVAYRMLLLNAGQKPMSIKHQVEILSKNLAEELKDIDDIEILSFTGSTKRTKPGQFSLAKLSQAFQAWLKGSPNIDVRNTVMEQLLAESALETLGASLSGPQNTDEFKLLTRWFVQMDILLWAHDQQFFNNETVLLGIAASVGAAERNDEIRPRMKRCLGKLLRMLQSGDIEAIAVTRFNDLRQGEDVRKVNVGQFTREMVYRAFQEYFVSDGSKEMKDCWTFGASQN